MILLFRVALLARDARSSAVSRYSALLLASIAAYIVESAPGFGALDLRLAHPGPYLQRWHDRRVLDRDGRDLRR